MTKMEDSIIKEAFQKNGYIVAEDIIDDGDIARGHAAVVATPSLIGDEPSLRVQTGIEGLVQRGELWDRVNRGGCGPLGSCSGPRDVAIPRRAGLVLGCVASAVQVAWSGAGEWRGVPGSGPAVVAL